MRYILLILALTLFIPLTGNAQSPAPVAIAPCLPATPAFIRLEGQSAMGDNWRQTVRDNAAFYALSGEQIQWLGYSAKGHESDEWYGQVAGFAGINMTLYGDAFLITIHAKDKAIIGRIEAHEYLEDYILFFTTLQPFGLKDGSRYDYHVPADVRGGACMFRVSAKDFNQVLGWE